MEQAYASPVKEIHFPSRIENLTLVEKMIDEVCEQFKVNQDHYGNILSLRLPKQ